MKIKLLFSFLLVARLCSAQISFHKTYGSDTTNQGAGRIIQTQDGGYIAAGIFQEVSPSILLSDMLLIRLDKYGDTLWTKISGDSLDDQLSVVKENADGSFIAFGRSNSFAPSPGYQDMFLTKTDPQGNTLWSYHYGGSNHENPANMMLTDKGNYLMIGNTSSFGGAPASLYLLEADTSGNLVQSRVYGIPNGIVTGLAGCISPGNGYLIGANLFDVSINKNSIYLNRIDSAGNLLWSKTYGGGNNDYFSSVIPAGDSGYVMCGYSYSFNDTVFGDIYVIKIDTLGNVIWSKTYGSSNQEWSYSIKNTFDGGYILSGHIHYNGQLRACGLKLDAGGNIAWWKEYSAVNHSGFFYDVSPTADSGFIFTGQFSGPVYYKVYVVKTDSAGESGCDQLDYNMGSVNVNTLVNNIPTNTSAGGSQYPAAFPFRAGLDVNTICIINGESEVKNFSVDDMIIYPNPSSGNFHLKINNSASKNYSVFIYNSIGEKIYSRKHFSNHADISLKEKAGIYFVRVNDGEKIYSEKLMVW